MTPLKKSARRCLECSWQWGWSLSSRLATPVLNEARGNGLSGRRIRPWSSARPGISKLGTIAYLGNSLRISVLIHPEPSQWFSICKET